MKISRAVLEDLDGILRLQKRAYLSEAKLYDDYSIPPLTQSLEKIEQEFANQIFLKGY